jgi:hypothetical protein
MLNLKGAVSTRKYWQSIETVQAENSRSIDAAEKMLTLTALNPQAGGWLKALVSEGVVIIPNYWSPDECAAGRAEIDRLIVEYPDAVRRFSGGSDKRMFGVEMVSDVLARFHNDPLLIGVGELHGGLELYNFATLGARIDATNDNNGSGDGWHRDGFGFQYKSILYLSDVADENGPFEYLPGSHKPWRVFADIAFGELPEAPQSRFQPSEIDRLVRRLHVRRRRYVAPQGTLILANVAGLHRGAPLSVGTRYALTNYFYHPYQLGDTLLEKFSPMMPGVVERVRGMLADHDLAMGHA